MDRYTANFQRIMYVYADVINAASIFGFLLVRATINIQQDFPLLIIGLFVFFKLIKIADKEIAERRKEVNDGTYIQDNQEG
jgi:hypothetical protein